MAAFALPAQASNHNSGQTILVVSDYAAPGDVGRQDDVKLVQYLGAGDPATPGFVDFGNGVTGAANEVLMVPSLGYTVDTTGMNGSMSAGSLPWLGALVGKAAERQAIDDADLVIFTLNRSGNYRDDRYRDVSAAGGGNGTTDINGLTVQESWNGVETPLLTFNSSFAGGASTAVGGATSYRFGWLETHADNESETATRMQIQPNQISNPFFNGLTTTADPDVPGGVEVELYDWTYDPSLGFVNGLAPLPVDLSGNVDLVDGYSRAPLISRRDNTDASLGEADRGVVPGGKIVSGFGGTNANGGGANILDIPKGTDFNVPDALGDPTNIPMDSPGNPNDVPFGVAGARRVLVPTWGYSLPVVGSGPSPGFQWGQFQTPDWFTLTENVIAEMLLNPDGASTGLAGDFDVDGDVDGADFLLWQRGTSVGNLADWESNYGLPAPLAAGSAGTGAVPEPSSLLLAVASALALAGGRRRRK